MHSVLDTTVAHLTGAIEFSIYGPLTAVQQVLPGMRALGRGTVLFVNGGSGARPNPKLPAPRSPSPAKAPTHRCCTHAGRGEHPRRPADHPGAITLGHPTHDPDVLADRLWNMHTGRDTFRVFAEPMNL